MKSDDLRAEADLLIERCDLPELLSAYECWFVGGSYSYDLMCWRDLDVYVLDPTFDLERCFELGYELSRRLPAKKARFTNNVSSPPKGNEPKGLYWGIKLGDERQGAWKLDIWCLDRDEYERHENYSSGMRQRLSAETRLAILEIKEAYWRRPEYRDTITSDLIYRAVLDHAVRSVEQFESSRAGALG
ncbi:MAG TPA: hypothetical protein VNG71_15880 [Pyrinomonadaceae bacterium]|nr:hypothetical protein [Pyrinomonadaceae bacterium]